MQDETLMSFKYLRELRPNCFHIDSAVRPETRAVLCAMASRIPEGVAPPLSIHGVVLQP